MQEFLQGSEQEYSKCWGKKNTCHTCSLAQFPFSDVSYIVWKKLDWKATVLFWFWQITLHLRSTGNSCKFDYFMLYSGMSVRLSITEITVVSYKDINKHGFARLGNKNKCFVGFIHMNAALISDYSLWVQVFHNKYDGYSFVCKAYSIDHLSVIALCCLNIYFSRTFFFLLSLPHRCLCFYLVLFCKPDTGALETSSGEKKKKPQYPAQSKV